MRFYLATRSFALLGLSLCSLVFSFAYVIGSVGASPLKADFNRRVQGPVALPGRDSSSYRRVNKSLHNSTSDTANATSAANMKGGFWAGADFGTLVRMEAIPGRVFYDFDSKTIKDPVKTLGDSGVNAARVESMRGQCLGPSNFVNSASTLSDELLFKLDLDCIDSQVKTAQRAVAENMRIQLTINQGLTIPKDLESLTYA